MAARLQRLTGAVAQAADPAGLAETLAALLQYWRHEVLPHAAAEESTIYADAARLPQALPLVRSLEYEHQDLKQRGAALEGLRARAAAAGTPGAGGPPAGEPALGVAAAMEAAAATAVFHVHAAKENDFVLPLLAEAGRPLPEVLARMERAFQEARRAAEAAPAAR